MLYYVLFKLLDEIERDRERAGMIERDVWQAMIKFNNNFWIFQIVFDEQ